MCILMIMHKIMYSCDDVDIWMYVGYVGYLDVCCMCVLIPNGLCIMYMSIVILVIIMPDDDG